VNDVSKSFLSFAWALGLLGLEQLGTALGPGRSGHRKERLTGAFDAVTEAAEAQLGERSKKLFDAGDALQRELLDLVFDVTRVDNLKPRKVLDRAADLADKAADSLRDAAQEPAAGGAEAPASTA
jgi:hypothetical protein